MIYHVEYKSPNGKTIALDLMAASRHHAEELVEELIKKQEKNSPPVS